MLRFVTVCAAILFAQVLASGCSPVPAPDVTTASPDTAKATVEAYFEAWATGDRERMDGLVTAHAREEGLYSGDGDLPRIDISDIEIRDFQPIAVDASHPSHMRDYAETREGRVYFDVLEATPGEDAGRWCRFVIVARESPSSPWRIESYGTGP
ncbi:DUF4829 domain-containing protein [bacterium]|nr:MAG: DUF4829 domain-containing protein [bacterium]